MTSTQEFFFVLALSLALPWVIIAVTEYLRTRAR